MLASSVGSIVPSSSSGVVSSSSGVGVGGTTSSSGVVSSSSGGVKSSSKAVSQSLMNSSLSMQPSSFESKNLIMASAFYHGQTVQYEVKKIWNSSRQSFPSAAPVVPTHASQTYRRSY